MLFLRVCHLFQSKCLWIISRHNLFAYSLSLYNESRWWNIFFYDSSIVLSVKCSTFIINVEWSEEFPAKLIFIGYFAFSFFLINHNIYLFSLTFCQVIVFSWGTMIDYVKNNISKINATQCWRDILFNRPWKNDKHILLGWNLNSKR